LVIGLYFRLIINIVIVSNAIPNSIFDCFGKQVNSAEKNNIRQNVVNKDFHFIPLCLCLHLQLYSNLCAMSSVFFYALLLLYSYNNLYPVHIIYETTVYLLHNLDR
jgi:hypothetical protein